MAYRTHTCGELRKGDAGKQVILSGWVDTLKIMKKFAFLNLRDRYGTTQVFFDETFLPDLKNLKRESVITVEGTVKEKPSPNPKLATGAVEVAATKLTVLSQAKALPMELDENITSTEETRLTYRYLDLRKPRLQRNLALRHKLTTAVRTFLDKEGFLEIETPFLAKSTPEGARDYLVPSRIHKGTFYALPQSPQLFKQLLMIAGYDKYFQIVRCFRDEDLRADRQPEFTQIDMEMSFIEEDDLFDVIERMIQHVFKHVLGVDITIPFERLNYADVMKQHGTDRPDLRAPGEDFHFSWIINFPMFEYSEEEGRYKAMHHPFTLPQNLEEKDPAKILARAYDLVLNGNEIAGGSLRIFDYNTQMRVFKLLGINEDEAKEKFGFLLDAMQYGNPPLGGIAFGLDRFAMLLVGEESIREVIAFPKNKDAEDMMLQAPSKVSKAQLDELGLTVTKQ